MAARALRAPQRCPWRACETHPWRSRAPRRRARRARSNRPYATRSCAPATSSRSRPTPRPRRRPIRHRRRRRPARPRQPRCQRGGAAPGRRYSFDATADGRGDESLEGVLVGVLRGDDFALGEAAGRQGCVIGPLGIGDCVVRSTGPQTGLQVGEACVVQGHAGRGVVVFCAHVVVSSQVVLRRYSPCLASPCQALPSPAKPCRAVPGRAMPVATSLSRFPPRIGRTAPCNRAGSRQARCVSRRDPRARGTSSAR